MRLSDFKITTRVCAGFLLLGLLSVCISFYGYFAQDAVHNGYMRSNAQIDVVRKLSLLESHLMKLNNALSLYALHNDAAEEQAVWDAFSVFDDALKEDAPAMMAVGVQNTEKFLQSVQNFRKKIEEIASLSEKVIIARERLVRQGEQTQEKLGEMIAESTLPSATFALTNLQEQLQSLLLEAQKTDLPLDEYTDNMQAEIDTLNKVAQTVRQAEMVNIKQLKAVLSGLETLQEELHRGVKTAGATEEREKEGLSAGNALRTQLKEIIDSLLMASASVLFEAETAKLNRQKIFIFFAAFSGVLILVSAFFALKGLRAPFHRLIGDIFEFSHGEPKESVPFADRKDEIGLLAQALTALLEAWKNPLLLSSSKNYLPLGTAEGDNTALSTVSSGGNDGFVYLGDENADAETQLRQMLLFLTNVQNAAQEMQNAVHGDFGAFSEHSEHLKKTVQALVSATESLPPLDIEIGNARTFSDQVRSLGTSFLLSSDKLMQSAQKQEEAAGSAVVLTQHVRDFMQELLQWINVMTDVSNAVHKTSLQTKIFALNASIEALKLGEKAKPCNDLISEIRSMSQQTAGSVDKMMENMCALKDEAKTLNEIVDGLTRQLQVIQNISPEICMVCTDVHQDSYTLSEKMPPKFAAVVQTLTNIVPLTDSVTTLSQTTEKTVTDMAAQTDDICHRVDDFITLLPSAEDGSGNA